MINQQPFCPSLSYALAVGSVSAAVAIEANAKIVRLFNPLTVPVFVQFGVSSGVTASATSSLCLAPNTVEVLTKGVASYLAAIAPSGTGTLYVTTGDGF